MLNDCIDKIWQYADCQPQGSQLCIILYTAMYTNPVHRSDELLYNNISATWDQIQLVSLSDPTYYIGLEQQTYFIM